MSLLPEIDGITSDMVPLLTLNGCADYVADYVNFAAFDTHLLYPPSPTNPNNPTLTRAQPLSLLSLPQQPGYTPCDTPCDPSVTVQERRLQEQLLLCPSYRSPNILKTPL